MNSKADADLAMGDAESNVPISHESSESSLRRAKCASILTRLVAAPLCIIAMVLMITNKETHLSILSSTPLTVATTSAKYSSIKALEFFVYTNGIVGGYLLLHALFSVLTSCRKSVRPNRFGLVSTFVIDQLMVYALLAAAAATTEVAYIAENGNSASAWEQICGKLDKFCHRIGVSIIICFTAVMAMIILAAMSARQLFKGLGGGRPQYGRAAPAPAAAHKKLGSR